MLSFCWLGRSNTSNTANTVILLIQCRRGVYLYTRIPRYKSTFYLLTYLLTVLVMWWSVKLWCSGMRWPPPGAYPPHYGRPYAVMESYHCPPYGQMMAPQPYPFDRAPIHPPLDRFQVNTDAVVTCEMELFWNIILKWFQCFISHHVTTCEIIFSAAEIISKLFRRHWTRWKIFTSCNIYVSLWNYFGNSFSRNYFRPVIDECWDNSEIFLFDTCCNRGIRLHCYFTVTIDTTCYE